MLQGLGKRGLLLLENPAQSTLLHVAWLQGQHTTNPPPFCADLYNPRNLPYGFHSVRLRRLGDGFPAVLDINLSQEDVLSWLGFLQEGLYLGSLTRWRPSLASQHSAPCRICLPVLSAPIVGLL
jgi:hypothetical protein